MISVVVVVAEGMGLIAKSVVNVAVLDITTTGGRNCCGRATALSRRQKERSSKRYIAIEVRLRGKIVE
jgi:hypothetical protein